MGNRKRAIKDFYRNFRESRYWSESLAIDYWIANLSPKCVAAAGLTAAIKCRVLK